MHSNKQFFSAFLIEILMLASINAQNFHLTFTGSGLSTNVDSVQVLNIAQGTSVTVKGSEGLQLVGTYTDIETEYTEKCNFRLFPNPMTETSGIEFLNLAESLVNVEVIDIAGKIVIRSKQNLIQGSHKFEISGLNPGIYMVHVLTFNGGYVGKLISKSRNSSTPSIRYLGSNFSSSQKSVLKNTQNIIQMPYTGGERLLLKGISGNYARVLTLIPTQDQIVNFEFIACTDADKNHYAVVTIGTQTWMAENLKHLPSVNPSTTESNSNPCYYVYGYEGSNVNEAKATKNYQSYGVLYNWPAAMIHCPAGWYLPDDKEWTILENYLLANGYNFDGTTSANKMAKSLASSKGWLSSSVTGAAGNTDYPINRNATGFTALPGGNRAYAGGFNNIDSTAYWWGASDFGSIAWMRRIGFNTSDFRRIYADKVLGFPVRCLRDKE